MTYIIQIFLRDEIYLRFVRSNHCELYGLIDNFFFTPPSYLLGIPTYLHASENSLIQYTEPEYK